MALHSATKHPKMVDLYTGMLERREEMRDTKRKGLF